MERRKLINIGILALVAAVLLLAVWGPERLARYRDQATLNQITVEQVEGANEGYRYTLNSNEKLFILSKCLNNQVLPESELNSMTRVESSGTGYGELATGTYAFVVNRQGPSGKEITNEEIYEICNGEINTLKELGILQEGVRKVDSSAYSAVLYSAIDVLEPRNNLSVWKVSLSTSQQNADKTNRLLDIYIDADTGKIYEFYVRTQAQWAKLDPGEIVQKWSDYLGLAGMEEYEVTNPLLETTPYFRKYRFPGMNQENTVVTVGFYEGISELFLKISK